MVSAWRRKHAAGLQCGQRRFRPDRRFLRAGTQVAAVDPAVASIASSGREFVFDVQGHFVGQHGLGKPVSAVPSNSSR